MFLPPAPQPMSRLFCWGLLVTRARARFPPACCARKLSMIDVVFPGHIKASRWFNKLPSPSRFPTQATGTFSEGFNNTRRWVDGQHRNSETLLKGALGRAHKGPRAPSFASKKNTIITTTRATTYNPTFFYIPAPERKRRATRPWIARYLYLEVHL
jgi:hypothetical protein